MVKVLAILVGLLTVLSFGVQADSLVTVSGVISDDGQLIGGDGIIYEIADNEIGQELMEMIDNRVVGRGEVVSVDDAVILVVKQYEVVR